MYAFILGHLSIHFVLDKRSGQPQRIRLSTNNMEKEKKLIEAGFEYFCYSERNEVAIYRKPK